MLATVTNEYADRLHDEVRGQRILLAGPVLNAIT